MGKVMKYTIDRIGEKVVICENENGDMVKVQASELPEDVREGDILTEAEGTWTLEKEETERRRQKIREKLRGLTE
ncbi:DUF3006 domain-containing protein [Lacrimispora sp.]|nr:DUF3006 domain-containing protein [Lacrimispora sp.]